MMMKTLDKALKVLSVFLNNKEEMTLSEIAALAKVNKATTNRIVATLTKNGYLNQREKRGKYSLGTIYMEFTKILTRNLVLRDIAIPYVDELNRTIGETIILGNWSKSRGTLVAGYFTVSSSPLKVVPEEGGLIPLHSTCSGKIVLAEMSETELHRYFTHDLKKYTSKTIVDFNKMKSQILKIKREGIAVDDEEKDPGVRGIATGIKDYEGQLSGTISITVPSIRFSMRKIKDLSPELKKCAQNISEAMGFRV
jgi:IclR family transcriptional regulator, KDG regulon repressor